MFKYTTLLMLFLTFNTLVNIIPHWSWRVAKALASLHICRGNLSLRHCTKISCAASNDDLCAIHASSVDSGESAYLRWHSHWAIRLVSRSHVLAAKALASLHICTGSPEPCHRKKNIMCWFKWQCVYRLIEQRIL